MRRLWLLLEKDNWIGSVDVVFILQGCAAMNLPIEILRTAIFNHPKECIFTPNAIESIMAKCKSANFDIYSPFALDFLADAFEAEEIYCPHEDIDRRQEYYSKINLAAWSEWASIAHEMV